MAIFEKKNILSSSPSLLSPPLSQRTRCPFLPRALLLSKTLNYSWKPHEPPSFSAAVRGSVRFLVRGFRRGVGFLAATVAWLGEEGAVDDIKGVHKVFGSDAGFGEVFGVA